MKLRDKIIIGAAALLALAGIAVAQVPALFLSLANLTGNEQFDVREPSTGTVTTGSRTLTVTLTTIAQWAGQFAPGTVNTTATSYTFNGTGSAGTGAAPDAGKLVTFNNAS